MDHREERDLKEDPLEPRHHQYETNLSRLHAKFGSLHEGQPDATFLDKIKKPLVWCYTSCGVRIEDLHPHYYDDVIELIKVHYLEDEPLFKCLNVVKDEHSFEEFLIYCQYWIDDTSSIVAVDDKTKEVVGALIGRVCNKNDMDRELSRMLVCKNSTLRKIQAFKHYISKRFNPLRFANIGRFYNIYFYVVHRNFRRKGIGEALLASLHGVCRGYRIKLAGGIFTSLISQRMFFFLGGRNGYEVAYKDWLIDDRAVFMNTGPLNYSAAFMYLLIKPYVVESSLSRAHLRDKVPRRKTKRILKLYFKGAKFSQKCAEREQRKKSRKSKKKSKKRSKSSDLGKDKSQQRGQSKKTRKTSPSQKSKKRSKKKSKQQAKTKSRKQTKSSTRKSRNRSTNLSKNIKGNTR